MVEQWDSRMGPCFPRHKVRGIVHNILDGHVKPGPRAKFALEAVYLHGGDTAYKATHYTMELFV